MISIADHPLLECEVFQARLPRALGLMPSPPELAGLLKLDAPAPLASSDEVRAKVRDLLRHGGFKPTGRSKPASEYLIRAATDGTLASINLVVDACNTVSLHSGLPISVIDLDRAKVPLSIRVEPEGSSYVFNSSGQTIDVGGLLSLCDADGACANAVKDAQRTKTCAETKHALIVIWGTNQLAGRARDAARWYRELLETSGVSTESVPTTRG